MKKEAIALIALLFLIAFVTMNVIYIHKVTDELCEIIGTSQAAYEKADYETAEDELHRAMSIWGNSSAYSHIALRHTDIDTITESFYDLLSEIYAQTEQAYGGYENIIEELNHLAEMETPYMGSIF